MICVESKKILWKFQENRFSHLFVHKLQAYKQTHTLIFLLEFTTLVNNGCIEGKQTDVINIDFSKTFYKVNHNLLVHKLYRLGFSSSLLNWIKLYLVNRQKCVKFKNTHSNFIDVVSSVPQGSHLRLLLFILFINNLSSVIQTL